MPAPLQFIADASFFRGLKESSRQALAEIAAYKALRKGEVLFREGLTGRAVFVCHTGRIQLHKTAPDGGDVVIKIVQPPETFAEVILFEADLYPVTATALTTAAVIAIPRLALLAMFDRLDFRNDFLAMLMRKQRYLAERIVQLTSHSADQRLIAFLREQGGDADSITLPLSKKSVATAIGVTPEHLSRLLGNCARRGILRWSGSTITWGRLKK
ncbi:MAG: Crp/Fnr family transcriptional regulator [bacterium]